MYWIALKMIRELTTYLELNDEIHSICLNLWGTSEATFMEKVLSVNIFLRAQERLKKNTTKQKSRKKKKTETGDAIFKRRTHSEGPVNEKH